jgi:carbamoyltransferase
MGDRPGQTLRSIATGPAFGPDDCKAALEESGLRYRAVDDAPDAAAECLARGDVVCWFDGAMEGGPRALGHRSILADPSTTATRDRVNDVKRRSLWRPLAPSVRMEDRAEVFESGRHSPFMIVADRVSPSWCSRISAVVHVDGTARPQTVDREVEPAYWSVIDGFHKRTGLPALINTSFNDEREPIVCSPADAIATFARNGADALCLGPYLIEKGD